ncbi:aflatoxin B1-aldehyde reductase [Artomyces pyxidatus]|uniref:Aflatoxin B1-aldehyde reductase n=1 Tax=Artomyces pyxidatus TaxID=48021 RepID=A0ACB8T294_9AGAM|nr:aflatoxin B1-aldehyde reductase [Artomyces pyxidatus]
MTDSRVPALLGAGGFGASPATDEPFKVQPFIDVLLKHGHHGVDTARTYGSGQSEVVDLKDARVDTKIYPAQPGYFAPEKFKELVQESVKALNGVKIRTLYLHAPDRSVPVEDTLGAVNDLYKEGIFESFGLSNYYSWEVSEIVAICRLKGYVPPTVYQGIYNCIDRVAEDELFPCLRKYNIRFAAYSPLAGGFLSNAHLDDPSGAAIASNVRFNPAIWFSSYYIPRYAHSVPVLRELKTLGEKHGMELNEIAARWIAHHSQMRATDVGVIYGGSKPESIDRALTHHAKDPLPEEIVNALEDAWLRVKAKVPNYAHS